MPVGVRSLLLWKLFAKRWKDREAKPPLSSLFHLYFNLTRIKLWNDLPLLLPKPSKLYFCGSLPRSDGWLRKFPPGWDEVAESTGVVEVFKVLEVNWKSWFVAVVSTCLPPSPGGVGWRLLGAWGSGGTGVESPSSDFRENSYGQ